MSEVLSKRTTYTNRKGYPVPENIRGSKGVGVRILGRWEVKNLYLCMRGAVASVIDGSPLWSSESMPQY